MPILPQNSGQILELEAHPTQLPVAGAFYLYSVAGVVYRMNDAGVYNVVGDTGDSFGLGILGGATDISVGYKSVARAKSSGTILSYRIDSYAVDTNAAVVGSISIDVKKNGATIGTAALSAASSVNDTTLSGWTTDIVQGDLLQYEVTANSGVKNLTLTLFFSKLVAA